MHSNRSASVSTVVLVQSLWMIQPLHMPRNCHQVTAIAAAAVAFDSSLMVYSGRGNSNYYHQPLRTMAIIIIIF